MDLIIQAVTSMHGPVFVSIVSAGITHRCEGDALEHPRDSLDQARACDSMCAVGTRAVCSPAGVFPAIQASMQKPQEFPQVLNAAFLMVGVLCTFIGTAGYYMCAVAPPDCLACIIVSPAVRTYLQHHTGSITCNLCWLMGWCAARCLTWLATHFHCAAQNYNCHTPVAHVPPRTHAPSTAHTIPNTHMCATGTAPPPPTLSSSTCPPPSPPCAPAWCWSTRWPSLHSPWSPSQRPPARRRAVARTCRGCHAWWWVAGPSCGAWMRVGV